MRRFETGLIGRDDFAAALIGEFGVPVGPAEFMFNGRFRLASVSQWISFVLDRFSNAWSLDAAFHHNFPSHLPSANQPRSA